MEYKNSYQQAEFFGLKNRLIKLSEECAELAQASVKYHEVLEFNNRSHHDYIEHLKEEMADVMLLCSEVRHLLGIEIDEIIPIVKFKVERTIGVIDEVLQHEE